MTADNLGRQPLGSSATGHSQSGLDGGEAFKQVFEKLDAWGGDIASQIAFVLQELYAVEKRLSAQLASNHTDLVQGVQVAGSTVVPGGMGKTSQARPDSSRVQPGYLISGITHDEQAIEQLDFSGGAIAPPTPHNVEEVCENEISSVFDISTTIASPSLSIGHEAQSGIPLPYSASAGAPASGCGSTHEAVASMSRNEHLATASNFSPLYAQYRSEGNLPASSTSAGDAIEQQHLQTGEDVCIERQHDIAKHRGPSASRQKHPWMQPPSCVTPVPPRGPPPALPPLPERLPEAFGSESSASSHVEDCHEVGCNDHADSGSTLMAGCNVVSPIRGACSQDGFCDKVGLFTVPSSPSHRIPALETEEDGANLVSNDIKTVPKVFFAPWNVGMTPATGE